MVHNYDLDGNNLNSWSVTSYEPYIIDMGHMQPGQRVEVSVYGDGAATGNIYLKRLDAEAFEKHLSVLQAGGMTVTEQTGHSLKGTVTATRDGAMFFSLPYDKGWQVYVDGKPVKTFPVDRGEDKVKREDGLVEYVENDDGAFLAAELPAGEHMVEIVYVTPGGKVGSLITGGSLLLLLIPLLLWIFRRRRLCSGSRGLCR